MSHIKKETVRGFDAVHPAVLGEGIKVAAQLLALQGVQVTDFIYDWNGNKVQSYDGMQVICGLGAEGAVSSHKFGGLGLAIDKNGKLAIVGDFYHQSDKKRAAQLRKQVEAVLGGACYFAARAMVASAKGQKTEVKINQSSRQLQLVVQM